MHISLINLPRYEIHRPPLSLAILAEICNQEKVDYDCTDLSLLIYKQLAHDFIEIDNFCITQQISPTCKQRLEVFVDSIIAEILKKHPDTIFALSLLSTWSLSVCEIVCSSIRKQSNCKILLGGQGLANEQWTTDMLKTQAIDYFIIGEGEISFRKFLNAEFDYPGINNYNFVQIDNLDEFCVVPDYSKLQISEYPYLKNESDLFITASRGCVRRCSYCNIGHQWKKYRYRSAEHVAQEMITQFERHGVTSFFFTDSLINGSMKMLDELCNILIKYKHTRPDANFKWRGQYIFRPRTTVTEDHIQRMVSAGVDYLIVGLETGSDAVRFDMNKKHTTDDAEWYLEMFKKYGIPCQLLMITGWVTETEQDHQDTLALFSRWQKFVASGTITGIELGSTLSISEHSPLDQSMEKYQISLINNKPYLWQSGTNTDLTIAERFRRRVETHYEAMKYRWPITRGLYRLGTIKKNLIEAIEYVKNNPGQPEVTKQRPVITINVEQ